MKALLVFGTRPEAIKMAPLIKEMLTREKVQIKICVTGQHKEMLLQVLALFDLKVDYNLNVMSTDQTLSSLTAKIITELSPVLDIEKPNVVIVHGDTTTTLAASLTSYYKKIDVAHVEAGLRTGHMYSPWPEEINRKLTADIARLHFAPTEIAKKNLLSEGINSNSIYVTGNTVIDALISIKAIIQNDPLIIKKMEEKFNFLTSDKKIILVTGHRRENFGEGFKNICKAINQLASRDDVQVVYPVHPNPSVKKSVEDYINAKKNVYLIDPLEYLPFAYLLSKSYLVLTDSGGIQEEAPSFGVPVLVMRDTTERPEGVMAGTVKLVGSNISAIVENASLLIDSQQAYDEMANKVNPYGDGHAAIKIADALIEVYG